ncbi:CSC1-like protein [Hibiscus syriacus]|uniref:CSC1-like protein n=1 Tax=Hibiscus syriacus TaxID=106335 RepID=A0A6A2YHQ2_HIBSY|nr:CSC1-like protein [Hibiscus syriacus]
MDIGALLTSAGINIAVCVVLLSLYSILRKQPSNDSVYFMRRLISEKIKPDPLGLERLVPSASWIVRAWQATDEDVLVAGGVDALVFLRIVVFSIRIFIIAAVICVFLVLPVNYYGQEMQHKKIGAESLEVFTIGNVKEGSIWFWVHCLALYVISCSACVLLYFEYKSITKMRLAHITGSPVNPSHFTVLVRGIPWSRDHSYSETVEQFFSTYYPASYVSHQMVYRASRVDKLMKDAEKMCRMLKTIELQNRESYMPSCLSGGTTHSFTSLNIKPESFKSKTSNSDGLQPSQTDKERSAAFVFFRTRYDAVVAAQVLQSSNPMLWVTQLAPEPNDVYWSNLSIPYKQVWLRRIATLLGAIVFMFLFLVPVTFVQGLTQLDQLRQTFPFLRGILKQKFMNQLVTGYLPSVILMLFMYAVPPTMMLFSTIEGVVSRSERKKSACIKVLYFTIWNVFFVNVLSGSIIRQLSVFSSVKDIPTQLAKAVPTQATFFTTYVLTSGWASLSCEVIQLFPFLCNWFKKFIPRTQEEPCSSSALTFPHHTEIPRLLLFGLLGFTCSIMAPLILPFLLVYFFLSFLVYRNQILNVYVPEYESGGLFWPIVHNTTIFSLVLTQVIALGVFGIKRSPVASGFIIPLIFLTLLFNEYCRQRFSPVFKRSPAQVLIEKDRQEENLGRGEEIYKLLRTSYCQFPLLCPDLSISQDPSTSQDSMPGNSGQKKDHESSKDPESPNPGMILVLTGSRLLSL